MGEGARPKGTRGPERAGHPSGPGKAGLPSGPGKSGLPRKAERPRRPGKPVLPSGPKKERVQGERSQVGRAEQMGMRGLAWQEAAQKWRQLARLHHQKWAGKTHAERPSENH
ncbi:unnamed protein product [Linum trigynum]|uniref:Uncharacterized protein n=1 Tax=Linum trigynum TaxID=586398 RepID=A0AAV2DBT8_9ROSI